MAKTGLTVIYPDIDFIIAINKKHIAETGGSYSPPDNLINPGSLEWILEAIQYPIFGKDMYPSIAEKAAALAWTIIRKHTFFDSNKRAGTSILVTFLTMNGYSINAPDDELIEIALMIAKGNDFSFDDFVSWVEKHIEVQTI